VHLRRNLGRGSYIATDVNLDISNNPSSMIGSAVISPAIKSPRMRRVHSHSSQDSELSR